MKPPYVIACAIGSFVVGAVAGSLWLAFLYSRNSFWAGVWGMSFEAFAGILLACVALIITLLGVFIAVVALYGFSSIKDQVEQAAARTATMTVETSLKPGGSLYQLTEKTVQAVAFRGAGLAESSGNLDPKDLEENSDV